MKILLATDGSSYSQAARAVLQRLPLPASSELTIVTVVEAEVQTVAGVPMSSDDRDVLKRLHDAQLQEAKQLLAQEAAYFEGTNWTVHTVLREGSVAPQILEAAEALGAELMVVGARGLSGFKRFLLGSVSHKMMKYAPCSVLVAKLTDAEAAATGEAVAPPGSSRLQLLLAYDGSSPARVAVDTLASLPLQDHVEVTITTVLTLVTAYRRDILQQLSKAWQEEKRAAQTALDIAAQALREATPHVTTQLREGADPSQEILTAARECNADLIVLGHKGKGGIERFLLGSVANRVVHYASCSVWVVKT